MKSNTAPTVPPMSSANERVRSLADSCFVPGPRCPPLLSSIRTRSPSPAPMGCDSLPASSTESIVGSWSSCFFSVFLVSSNSFMVCSPGVCLPKVNGGQCRLIDCGGVGDLQQQSFSGLLDRRAFKNHNTVNALAWIESSVTDLVGLDRQLLNRRLASPSEDPRVALTGQLHLRWNQLDRLRFRTDHRK